MEYSVEPKAKGKGFLRVTGILMIIGGGVMCVIGLVFLILCIIGVAQLGQSLGESIAVAAIIFIAIVICLAGSIIELITGIVGTKNAGKPERYKRCKVLGIIVLILQIISLVLTIATMILVNYLISELATAFGVSGVTMFPWWTILIIVILGIVVPVLFLIGVSRNKHSFIKEGVTSAEIKDAKERKKAYKEAQRMDAQQQRAERFENAKNKAADFASDVKDKAVEAKDKAADAAYDFKDKATDFAADVKDKAAEAREKAADASEEIKDETDNDK